MPKAAKFLRRVGRRDVFLPLAGDKPVTSVWYRHHMRIPGEWVKHGSQFLLHVQRTGHYA